jgi:hypothetical protein
VFKLAGLYVDIKAKDDALNSQLDGVRSRLGVMGVAIGTAAGALAASAIAGASSALAGFFARGIKGAIDLNETLSKVNVIFGEGAAVITRRADEMAAKFGTAKGEFLNAASDFGSAFKAIGKAQPEAAALGNQLAKLGMDMASFNNTSNADAFTALRAALRGEFDPLERFNVMLSAAAIEQEALSSGLIKSAKDMDEAAKKQATLNLILRKTIDQQGDLERTADGSANSWRKLTGTIDNLATSVGATLEPAVNALIAVGVEMASDLSGAFEASKGAFESFASGAVGWAKAIGVAWRNLPDLWDIVVIKATEMGTNLVAIFAVIPEDLNIIGEYIANDWRQLVTDGVNAVGAVFTNLGDNIYRLAAAVIDFLSDPTKGFEFEWKPLLDGFKATADALPELARPALVSLRAEIDEAAGRIADRESARASALADRAKAIAAPAKAIAHAAAEKEKDFKSEVMSGSEFALKMRASIYEQGDDTKKRQLAAAEQTARHTATIAEKLNRPPAAVLG